MTPRGPRPRTLTARSIQGIGWRTVGTVLELLITFAVGIALARLLTPAEYGLFALALSIAIVFEHVSGLGMLQALMQRQPLTPAHETAGLVLSLGGSVCCCLFLWAMAPTAAAWLRTPALASVLRGLSLLLLVRGSATLAEAHLYRDMAFGPLTGIRLTEKLVWAGVTLTLALQGSGTWALVSGSLASGGVMTGLLWWTARRHPLVCTWTWRAATDLLGFGTGSFCLTLATTLSHRLDVLIVGRELGGAAVGIYHRAAHLITLPLAAVMSPMNKVLLPALSQVQDDPTRLCRGYLAASRLAALAAIPLMVGLYGIAPVLIPVVYGPPWVAAVPVLQLLTIAGVCRILLTIQGVVVQAHGQVHAQAVRHWLWLGLIAVCGGVGSAWGVRGVAAGVCVATVIFLVSLTAMALRVTGARVRDLITALRTGLLASLAMGLCVWAVSVWLQDVSPGVVALGALVVVGLLTYSVAVRWLLTAADRHFLATISQQGPAPLRRLVPWLFHLPLVGRDTRRIA